MGDKPILFSAPMVRALLAGTKTQTRRTLKPQPVAAVTGFQKVFADHPYFEATVNGAPLVAAFPAGHGFLSAHPPLRYAIGDRLWVRETWCSLANGKLVSIPDAAYAMMKDGSHQYRDGQYMPGRAQYAEGAFDLITWRPGMYMPRWASRITLTVTDVRVERLQEISEGDALAEGCKAIREFCYVFDSTAYGRSGLCHSSPVIAYSILWDEINGPGSWDANPWVAAYTFTVQLGNIDRVAA